MKELKSYACLRILYRDQEILHVSNILLRNFPGICCVYFSSNGAHLDLACFVLQNDMMLVACPCFFYLFHVFV